MARTGTTVKPAAFLALASLVSLALFAFLLQSPAHGQYGGDQLLSVSLFPDSDRVVHDLSQIDEPSAVAIADSLRGRGNGPDRGNESGVHTYLPASQLTERPQLVVDIDPEWHLPGMELPVLVVLLLINEYGDVDKVVLDDKSLLPMLEEDIRSRFLAMKFVPGGQHGKLVKSALRIEVRLE